MMNSESDPMLASGLKILQSGAEIVVNICPKDILMITLGSIFAGSTLGANCSPPAPVPDVEELKLDDSWGLWCKLSQEHPEFVDLSPFCARIAESTNECFLVMLNGWEFFERFACLVHSLPSTGTLVSFKDNNWRLSLNVPRQQHFDDQPKVPHRYGAMRCPHRGRETSSANL